MEIENLFREILKKYAAYEPVEQINEEGWVILNTNENPYPHIEDILEDIYETCQEPLNREFKIDENQNILLIFKCNSKLCETT